MLNFINALIVSVVVPSVLLLLSADRVDSSSAEDIATTGGSTDLSNGWGQSIAWQDSLDTALSQASQQWKWL